MVQRLLLAAVGPNFDEYRILVVVGGHQSLDHDIFHRVLLSVVVGNDEEGTADLLGLPLAMPHSKDHAYNSHHHEEEDGNKEEEDRRNKGRKSG